MKSLKNLLNYKKPTKKIALDEKTIFFIFEKIIKEEYGEKGVDNIKPKFYKQGKIFLEIQNSNWANEFWLEKKNIISKINKKIGSDEVKEIKI